MKEVLISGRGRRWSAYLRDLYVFRGLFGFLAMREVQLQFVNMGLGFGWLLLRPLLQASVLAVIFGHVAKVNTGSTPYLLFVLSGFVAWSYFSGVTTRAGNSLLQYSGLISKAYFPRLYLPLMPVLTGLLELAVTLLTFILIAGLGYGRWPGVSLLWLPVSIATLVVFTTAVGIWLSALTVDYRDVRLASGYVLQALMFLTPVIWPMSLLNERLGERALALGPWLACYPMYGVLEGMRYALLGLGSPPLMYAAIGLLASLFLLLTGLRYFRNRDHMLADEI
ncbi:MAG: ABC transporter permease [Stagnimonas sp.]|nr:ABC transporter permease [Stagnimonas sp.]